MMNEEQTEKTFLSTRKCGATECGGCDMNEHCSGGDYCEDSRFCLVYDETFEDYNNPKRLPQCLTDEAALKDFEKKIRDECYLLWRSE